MKLINVFKKWSVYEVTAVSQSWQLATASDDEV